MTNLNPSMTAFDFVAALRQVSRSLSSWASDEIKGGASVSDLYHRLKSAVAVVDGASQ